MKNLNLNYQVDIQEQGMINGDFIIQGIAINSVVTSNNHKFLPEELQKSAQTLRGVPLLIDHENKVSSIKGRVLVGEFNEMNENVEFRAKVMDEGIKELIKDGRLQTVSVGAIVEDIEEMDGIFIPRGITFKELSLVAVPADSGATFQIALKEAYNANKGDIQINIKEVKMSEEDAKVETPEEEVKPEPKEEEVKTEEPETKPEKESEEESTPEPAVTEEKVKQWMKQAIKEADEDEKPVEAEKEEPKEAKEEEEEDESEVSEGYKIDQSFGSIKGGAFTLVR